MRKIAAAAAVRTDGSGPASSAPSRGTSSRSGTSATSPGRRHAPAGAAVARAQSSVF